MKTQIAPIVKAFKWLFIISLAIAAAPSEMMAATITSGSSGDWNNTSTWLGGVVPGAGDDVIIADGHSVDVSDSRSAASVTVSTSSSAASLNIQAAGALTVSGNVSIVSDIPEGLVYIHLYGILNIQGNLSFNSLWYQDAFLRFFSGGHLILHGTIDNYEEGEIRASGIANSTITLAGSISMTLPVLSSDPQYRYFNLIVDKSSSATVTLGGSVTGTRIYGNITVREGRLSNGGFSVTGASGRTFSIEDGGTYIMTGTTDLPATFTHNFQSGSTVVYSSNSAQTVNNPNAGTFHNIQLEGSGTKTMGANISLNGNLSILAGTLDASASNYNIDIKGNWNNVNGTFNARNATVTFSGTGSQNIATNNNNFYNVTFANSASGNAAIALNSDVTVSNHCTMADGIISTGSNMLIISNMSASSISDFSSACYVNGTLRRYIDENTATYTFPVGSVNYQRADIKNNTMTGVTYIDARFGPLLNHADEDLIAADGDMNYLSVSPTGMWTIEPSSNPGSGSYDIYGYIAGMSGMLDNQFAILKRPTGSTSGADWSNGGGTINAVNGDGRLVAHGYSLRKGLTQFSEFAMGREQSSSSLPITLVDFSARLNVLKRVDVRWTTAAEINNDFFTVERSHNGINFEQLAVVFGAGNSSKTTNYHTVDHNPLIGISYYRLKQTDYDGTFTYSPIVTINNNNSFSPMSVNVFPNPVSVGGNISVSGTGSLNRTKVQVYDNISGRLVYEAQLDEENYSIPIDRNYFSAGMYLIKITDDTRLHIRKFIVQ